MLLGATKHYSASKTSWVAVAITDKWMDYSDAIEIKEEEGLKSMAPPCNRHSAHRSYSMGIG